jgi:hypothetical protein
MWHPTPRTCKHRFCPSCIERDTFARLRRKGHVLGAFEYPAHLVISPPNTATLLEAHQQYNAGFHRLKRSKTWREKIPRAFLSWGLTYKEGSDRPWHYHLHAIVDTEFVPRSALVAAAQLAFRVDRDPMVWVTRAKDLEGLWLEIHKGTKGDALRLIAAGDRALGEASRTLKGKKRSWFIGTYPVSVRHGDDFPVHYLERLFSHAESRCGLCGKPAAAEGWRRLRVLLDTPAAASIEEQLAQIGCQWERYDFYDLEAELRSQKADVERLRRNAPPREAQLPLSPDV